jgi:hypothetical protein
MDYYRLLWTIIIHISINCQDCPQVCGLHFLTIHSIHTITLDAPTINTWHWRFYSCARKILSVGELLPAKSLPEYDEPRKLALGSCL